MHAVHSFVLALAGGRDQRAGTTDDTALLVVLSVLYLRVLKWDKKVALTRIGAASNESRNLLLLLLSTM